MIAWGTQLSSAKAENTFAAMASGCEYAPPTSRTVDEDYFSDMNAG